MSKVVAVTGANGFIGSHIVKLLLSKGYTVRGSVQDLNPKDPAEVDFLKVLPNAENLSLFEGELLNEGCFDEVFEGCDCVFHLASPTLKDQRDMKMPEDEMINQGRSGTLNVLKSCKKNGVKTVVITSSMCAVTPKLLPEIIHEKHWADPEHLRWKGSYYAASKTLAERDAVEFLAQMTTESAFRLVRICPSFTVGPMLQPTANSSMERFAAICAGTHHKQIPNRSISMIDVRDVAAHHVAAYEKGKGYEARYLSLTEAWPWTLVYQALKLHCPQMKYPQPLAKGTKLRRVREYDTTRMKSLGVSEMSFRKVLREAIKAIEGRNVPINGSLHCHRSSAIDLPLEDFLVYGGYYDLGMGDGRFFMIDVACQFKENQRVSNIVKLSWLLEVGDKNNPVTPTIYALPETATINKDGEFRCAEKNILLNFKRVEGNSAGVWSVAGSIGGTEVSGKSFLSCVPYQAFGGTYYLKSATKSVVLDFSGRYNNTITDPNKNIHETFEYNPLQRLFSYEDGTVTSMLYINVAGGEGLTLTFVRYGVGINSSTTDFFKFPSPSIGLSGQQVGVDQLATFAGYYPLNTSGSFVSILVKETVNEDGDPLITASVGICVNDHTSTEYNSFVFENNMLTLGIPIGGLSLTFEKSNYHAANAGVTVIRNGVEYGQLFEEALSFVFPAPLTAFGHHMLTGAGCSVLLTQTDNNKTRIVYTQKDAVIFDTLSYVYSPVNQHVTVVTTIEPFVSVDVKVKPIEIPLNYTLTFCYQGVITEQLAFGVACAIILPNGGQQAVVFAYVDQ